MNNIEVLEITDENILIGVEKELDLLLVFIKGSSINDTDELQGILEHQSCEYVYLSCLDLETEQLIDLLNKSAVYQPNIILTVNDEVRSELTKHEQHFVEYTVSIDPVKSQQEAFQIVASKKGYSPLEDDFIHDSEEEDTERELNIASYLKEEETTELPM